MHHIHYPHAGTKLSTGLHIHETSDVVNSHFGEWTSVGPSNKIFESSFGDYTYTMDDVTVNYAEIGKFGNIASHACINPVQHPMDRVTQHHMTYRRKMYDFSDTDDEAFFDWRRTNQVTIGHDVWIGHGAIIMKGVHIGTGAVVGSGSVVTKDVPPFAIVVGIPARMIRMRFEPEIVDQLLQIAWWDWPRNVLEERFAEFNDIQSFIVKYGV
ncbi:acetyltransferase [Paenibacillus glucanolyticus]|jgi:phosphonate metabolism protein (transferase hexapeptide repeat family)|uniref:DapH/DapD/GlmU-related protein n=1 Tax=Paenibacillus TaxID=44249 RepID=UPI0003E1F90A|nr:MULTISPECIES: DapH/DapD/GlmU-related protein [Paenibacillus]ANA82964.1 acetyltransferase [Paenibacillus glucanolyticus]AVV57950.1 acetyltransferase [Paenibacillus glucanolyticus]AWP27110.1 acetyltransferase [Paenibacillus sp. Cedars]ETT34748.1 phosphonate metabolism protein [Paenibacillus sp. FSL R5-808]MPY18310.1 acetyltransferase [Paenibacillus glucanolyticus]